MSNASGNIPGVFSGSALHDRMMLKTVGPDNQVYDEVIDYQKLSSTGQIPIAKVKGEIQLRAWEAENRHSLVQFLLNLKSAKQLASTSEFEARNGKGGVDPFSYDKSKILSSFGPINDVSSQEYLVRVNADPRQVYKIIEAPLQSQVTVRNGVSYVGATVNGISNRFSLVMNNRAYSVDEKFAIGGSYVNIFVKNVERVQNGYRLIFEVADNQMHPNGVPLNDLRVGQELICLGNNKTEYSRHGSKVDEAFGYYAKGWTNSSRYQLDYTHYAKVAGEKNKGKQGFICDLSAYGGKERTMVTIDRVEWMTMRRALKDLDNQLMFGESLRNINGQFKTDANDGIFFSNAGLLHQLDSRNKRFYGGHNKRLWDDILAVGADANGGGGRPVMLIAGGARAIQSASAYIASTYNVQPEPLYIDPQARALITNSGGKHAAGINLHFNVYNTAAGTLIFHQLPAFSGYRSGTNKRMQSGPFMGQLEAEHSFFVLNLGSDLMTDAQNLNGFQDISLFSFIPNVTGTIAGLGENEIISNPQMVSQKHMYFNLSLHLHNTLGFMYFRPRA